MRGFTQSFQSLRLLVLTFMRCKRPRTGAVSACPGPTIVSGQR